MGDRNARLHARHQPLPNEHEPLGRIVVLEDTNDDGRMDKRTVFADGLVLPRALKVLDHGVLVGEPPNLWLMRDTNGDLKADTKELVTDNYGRRDANVEHNANRLIWALDNWMYTSEVDMYLRLQERQVRGAQDARRAGQWGTSQDDAGRIYRNTNESVLHVDLVPTPYFARNPKLLRTRGSYELLGQDGNEVNIVWPVHPTRGVNRGYQAGVLRDGRHAWRRSPPSAAPTVYRGDRLPAELYGNVFVVEPAGNLVSRIVHRRRRDDAAGAEGLRPRRVHRCRPTSGSGRSTCPTRPTARCTWSTCIAGSSSTRGFITEYLRDHILSRNLEQPTALGRIYRVVHETTKRDNAPGDVESAPRHGWSRRSRTRTAGGATPRSGCWSSATTSRRCRPSRSWRRAPRILGRGCMRCGPSTAWRASTRRRSPGRWLTAIATCASPRSGCPSDG